MVPEDSMLLSATSAFARILVTIASSWITNSVGGVTLNAASVLLASDMFAFASCLVKAAIHE